MFNKSKYIILFVFIILGSCLSGGISTKNDKEDNWSYYPGYDGPEYELISFNESQEAFPNPMKGFRPNIQPGLLGFRYHEYARVYKQYIRYIDLERTEEDTVQKIIEWSNLAWSGIEERNIKVIPRVVLTYPTSNKKSSLMEYWPNDVPQPSLVSRWTTKELENRLVNLIQKLGKAWDNDPRVAAVEMGLWGYWGEQHLLNDVDGSFNKGKIPLSMQKAIGDAFTSAFHNKKVMVRFPDTFKNYQFGYYWDCFALYGEWWKDGNAIIKINVWRTQMISGEIAYDINETSSLMGSSPNNTLSNDKYTNHLINWIKKTHASSLGWISEYYAAEQTVKENAAKIQKVLGYRYVIRSAIFNKRVNPGDNIVLGFKISNVGSAPFYYKWPVEISLLNQERELIYTKTINDIDITSWMPDETYTVNVNFDLQKEIKNGTYIIAISILDPAGNKPSLRFANENYYNGGRTPIGIIGIGSEPEFNNFGRFDLLQHDIF